MKIASIFLLLLLSFFKQPSLEAQETPPSPWPKATLKITGTGELKVVPDQAEVNMTVKATDMDFNKAVQKLNQKTDLLNKKLLSAGFSREEIKTSQLNVQENGEWRNGNYIDSGFVATQSIILRFKRDQQRMVKLMDAFSEEKGAEALFHFGFTLSDEARDQAEEELIRKAIQDSRNKASVIAKTSGVKLGKIKNIIYGEPEKGFGPMYEADMMASSAFRSEKSQSMPDLEVKEIQMQDTITIYWEME